MADKQIVKPMREVLPTDVADPDGVTLINIYSRGKTRLGRELSHFADTPFVHPRFGPFNSMEGFWHWFKSRERDDNLRVLVGGAALHFGRTQTVYHQESFPLEIMEANLHKINQHAKLKEEFIKSTLPFDHYYHYGNPGKDKVLIRPHCHTWLCAGFEKIRNDLKAEAGIITLLDAK